jgi:AcrR family transcriptional regulator
MGDEDNTRERLKASAMRLFSEHGIDGVSVRNIMAAAGARNSASVHYYFRTKDDLIHELVVDAARRSDRARTARLETLTALGRPLSVEDIVRAILEAESVGTGDPEQISEPPIGFGHMRFVAAMQMNHREMFMTAVDGRWNGSYLRCLDLIRQALPDVPADVLNQRLVFMFLFINASLSAREAAFVANPSGGVLWGRPDALDNLVNVISAGIMAR